MSRERTNWTDEFDNLEKRVEKLEKAHGEASNNPQPEAVKEHATKAKRAKS